MRIQLSSAVGIQALLNTVVQPIWDEVQIGVANAATVQFFVSGQASRTLSQTNLPLPGQIPNPDHFVVRGFAIGLMPRSTAAVGYVATGDSLQDISDFQRFLWQTIFAFNVGSAKSPVAYGHAGCFPCGFGLAGMVATGGATSSNLAYIVGNGEKQLGNYFSLGKDYGEYLGAGETFQGNFQWSATTNMSASFSTRPYLIGLWSQAVR